MRSELVNLRPKLETAFEFSQRQVRHLIGSYPDLFPIYTEGGRWQPAGETWTNWCEGFPGGMMWIFHLRTGDPWWREQAEHSATERLAEVERLQWSHLEEALRLGEDSESLPAEARFVWHPEGIWAVETYLEQHGAEENARLLEGIRRGWIHHTTSASDDSINWPP